MPEKEPKLNLPKGFVLDDNDPDMPKVIHNLKGCPQPEMVFNSVVTPKVITDAITEHNRNFHRE